MAVIIDIDHESSTTLTDATNYTSVSNPDNDLSIVGAAALAGTSYGLACVVDDTTVFYAQKTVTADTSGIVRVRYYLDPNSLTMANNDNFTLCNLYTGTTISFAYLNLGYTTLVGYQVQLTMVGDSANYNSGWFAVGDLPTMIEFEIVRASTNVAADGWAQLWIDGTSKATISNKDNFDKFVSFSYIRLGGISAIDAGTSGTFYVDELIVNNDGSEIGEVVPPAALSLTPPNIMRRNAHLFVR